MKTRVSKYRKVKPETPGSRIYWNAYVRWEEYCKEATYKYVIKKKPFYQFIIEEIDIALQAIAIGIAKTALSATREAVTESATIPLPVIGPDGKMLPTKFEDLHPAEQELLKPLYESDSTPPKSDNI